MSVTLKGGAIVSSFTGEKLENSCNDMPQAAEKWPSLHFLIT